MNKKIVLASFFFFFVLALSAQEARCGFKSAIIKSTTEAMGRKTETVHYIDDYGAKVAGVTTIFHVITIDNTQIVIMLGDKTGTKKTLPENRINYLRLTPENMMKNSVKEEGREEIDEKMCTKYSIVTGEPGREIVKMEWIWKGIALKTIVPAMGITTVVTDIQENVAIDPKVFLVPDDVTIQ